MPDGKFHKEELSIMSLNLRFGLATDGENSWDHRQKVFPALFEQFQPDFFCFQESNDFQTEFLRTLLPEYGCIGQREPAPSFWQNNLIFYHRKWHCRAHDHFFLSPTPRIPSRFPDSCWPRQCTCGQFSKNGHDLICLTTHFDFKSSVQIASAKIIKSSLDIYSPTTPVILCGDFNATPSDPCYSIFTQPDETEAAVHQPAFRNSFSPPFPGTFHGFTGQAQERHIDWILFRGELSSHGARVIDQAYNNCFPSDHFPVLADFKWCFDEV